MLCWKTQLPLMTSLQNVKPVCQHDICNFPEYPLRIELWSPLISLKSSIFCLLFSLYPSPKVWDPWSEHTLCMSACPQPACHWDSVMALVQAPDSAEPNFQPTILMLKMQSLGCIIFHKWIQGLENVSVVSPSAPATSWLTFSTSSP